MNKYYQTKNIYSAGLLEIQNEAIHICGIKNVMGVIVYHNNEELFYSILDDCFFRILPSREDLIANWKQYNKSLFVELYDRDYTSIKTLGTKLYEKLSKDSLTKEEIIANKEIVFLSGYFSDLDHELKTTTDVNYEDSSTISENIIVSEPHYRKKLGRTITYDPGHIYSKVK